MGSRGACLMGTLAYGSMVSAAHVGVLLLFALAAGVDFTVTWPWACGSCTGTRSKAVSRL